jgi:acetolactate synthase I/II/III large subunit
VRGYTQPDLKADDLALERNHRPDRKGRAPVLYCGGGIITSGAAAELKKFAEATNIPVTTTLMGIGGFPETHPLSLRWLGMHGAAFANWAVNGEYELSQEFQRPDGQAQGRRGFAARLRRALRRPRDRQVRGILQDGTIVHIDIDASELNKNRKAHLPVVGDIKDALTRLNALIAKRPIQRKKHTAWLAQIEEWKKKAPFAYRITEEIANSDHMVRPHARARRAKSSCRRWSSRRFTN